MQNKIKLEVLGLTYSQSQSGAYALVLGESKGLRRIPIIIGQSEAQAIAIQLQGLETPRPLTHDLIHLLMKNYNISLREVFIYKIEKEVFYSKLLCWREGEEIKEIDARTSDAIAMAVRENCPIYIDDVVFSESSIVIDPETEEEIEKKQSKDDGYLEDETLEELEIKLQKTIETEEFELASKIRDEINKRKE